MVTCHCFYFCFPDGFCDSASFYVYQSFVFPHLQIICPYPLPIFLLSYSLFAYWFMGHYLSILKCALLSVVYIANIFFQSVSCLLSLVSFVVQTFLISIWSVCPFTPDSKCHLYDLVNKYKSRTIWSWVFNLDSADLHVWLELRSHEIMTWAQVLKCLADWATQAPHAFLFWINFRINVTSSWTMTEIFIVIGLDLQIN